MSAITTPPSGFTPSTNVPATMGDNEELKTYSCRNRMLPPQPIPTNATLPCLSPHCSGLFLSRQWSLEGNIGLAFLFSVSVILKK